MDRKESFAKVAAISCEPDPDNAFFIFILAKKPHWEYFTIGADVISRNTEGERAKVNA